MTVTEHFEDSGNSSSDEMSEYLQMFLDETEEQLDDLVETLLLLEQDPASVNDLNEAFRLVHSIKGAAGMMGFDSMTVLTHHLENRFERFRSGRARLDQSTMNLVLRCIDHLRTCTNQLRAGEPLGGADELLQALRDLEQQTEDATAGGVTMPPAEAEETTLTAAAASDPESGETDSPARAPVAAGSTAKSPREVVAEAAGEYRVRVGFEAGLQLADLKARLIVSRLSGFGEIKTTRPPVDELESATDLTQFELVIQTEKPVTEIRQAADVDGVQFVDVDGVPAGPRAALEPLEQHVSATPILDDEPAAVRDQAKVSAAPPPTSLAEPTGIPLELDASAPLEATASSGTAAESKPMAVVTADAPLPTDKLKTKVVETMRVDIDRLDNLMNLAGELVVNRARFVQVSSQVSPALKKASVINRAQDFSDTLRRAIDSLKDLNLVDGDCSALVQELESGLEIMEEQSELWDNSRRCFGQMTEAIDQLTRVSDSLQRGVLETRMAPVGPLFNRFKRLVRDLSTARGKTVHLQIRGEKTELDKRMIDELGDPLVHLVRNSIDHGLETPEVRRERGKPAAGTIVLEASHSGNNVYIHVRDDGGGMDIEKIKSRLIDSSILSPAAAEELSDDEIMAYIWHPGFSTAAEVTDISGRGVGMDVVKTRVAGLNGTIDIESRPRQGTTFAIRLPLTLAIINSLLVRIHQVVFSIPIDDVREIVSVKSSDIITVHGKQTFEVRGEFIPLASINDGFKWHDVDYGYQNYAPRKSDDSNGRAVHVVILSARGKTMGLRVDEMLGGQDIVIKSLSENFVDIPGLSGASILGDGTVCLMLDVVKVIEMAATSSRRPPANKGLQFERTT